MSDMDADPELQAIRDRKLRALMQVAGSHPSGAPAAPGRPIDVTDADIDDAVSRYPIAVVDCWAPWCGPCKMMAPVFEELARRYRGRVAFLKLNTDENQRTAARFAIMGIPTLLLFRNGSLADRIVGAQPANVIDTWIRRHL